jgi:hypothetical protein
MNRSSPSWSARTGRSPERDRTGRRTAGLPKFVCFGAEAKTLAAYAALDQRQLVTKSMRAATEKRWAEAADAVRAKSAPEAGALREKADGSTIAPRNGSKSPCYRDQFFETGRIICGNFTPGFSRKPPPAPQKTVYAEIPVVAQLVPVLLRMNTFKALQGLDERKGEKPLNSICAGRLEMQSVHGPTPQSRYWQGNQWAGSH